MTSEREAIISDLQPLFEKARLTGKWFRSPYQNIWFSPDELEKTQSEGRFIWGLVNWELHDPAEREESLKTEVRQAIEELERFQERLKAQS